MSNIDIGRVPAAESSGSNPMTKRSHVRLDTTMKGKPTCWKAVTPLFVWQRNTVQYDFQKHKCTAGKRTSCHFADLLNLFYSCREGSKMHFISTTVPTETFCIWKKARATYRVLAGAECWPPWSLALRNILFFCVLLLPGLILLNM